MNNQILKMLNEEIQKSLEELEYLTDAEERERAIKNIAALHELRMQEEKITSDAYEFDEKNERAKEENKLKEKQVSESKKDKYIRLVVCGVEVIVPIIFYASWLKKGFKFEETGTFTSSTFRGLWNRFRPTTR